MGIWSENWVLLC